MATLLVRNGHLLDPDLPFEPADVLVDQGRIARIGRDLGRADRIVDATGRVVMPGLINTHTHGVQILDRGMGDGLTLDQWGVFGAFGAQPLSPRDLYALTAWNALTLLRGGCTAVMDVSGPTAIFDDGIDAIMQAHLDTGIRATVALTLVDMDFYRTLPPSLMGGEPLPTMPFTRPDAAFHLAAARRFLTAWQARSPRVQPALGPSAPQ
ncbi:MAG: amidohydrolase family protein, partial [Solirubrobacteraceae bacterium]